MVDANTKSAAVNIVRVRDDALYAKLVKAAAERDVSVHWLGARAIADFLDRLVPVGQLVETRP